MMNARAIMYAILQLKITLFIMGFLYGAMLGTAKRVWWQRGLAAGLFFAFLYIALPVCELESRLESRRWKAGH